MATLISGSTGVNKITDGTIVDADVANIAASKLTGTVASARMPTGSVLQVVNDHHDSMVTTSSQTYTDTGLEAAITPSSASNNILILVTLPVRKHNTSSNDTSAHVKIIRGSTTVKEFGRYMAWNNTVNNYAQETVSFCYTDTAADTTSATTYKVQIKTNINGNSTVSSCHDSSMASLTLMEIAG